MIVRRSLLSLLLLLSSINSSRKQLQLITIKQCINANCISPPDMLLALLGDTPAAREEVELPKLEVLSMGIPSRFLFLASDSGSRPSCERDTRSERSAPMMTRSRSRLECMCSNLAESARRNERQSERRDTTSSPHHCHYYYCHFYYHWLVPLRGFIVIRTLP